MQKKIIFLGLFLMIVFAFTLVPQAYAYWDTIIDVLVVESERFTAFADFLNGYYRWLWYWDLDNAFNDFWKVFQIKFALRGVIRNWHIDCISDNAYYVLKEAISDFKYKSGETTYNGYVIDLLIVFVDWDEIDMIGFSPPDWKALIISSYPFGNVPMVNVFVHELSHQFYATHCGNPNCVMWGGGLVCWKVTWVCQKHFDEINTNRNRFNRWVVHTASRGGGGGWCWCSYV